MLYYLQELTDWFGPFRVFEYITLRAGGACVTAFLLSLFFGNRVILKLVSLKVGQPIRTAAEVHKLAELHGNKAGTPTMGGVLILGSILVSTLLWARPDSPFIWALLFILIVLGYLGFRDDYAKVTKNSSDGVSARFKIVIQFTASAAAVAFLYYYPAANNVAGNGLPMDHPDYYAGTENYVRQFIVPFLIDPLEIKGLWVICFILLAVVVIIGSSNAVNLTDGLDGLAAGCMVIAAMTFAIFGYAASRADFAAYLHVPHHPGAGEVTVFCTAMVGAGLGFLWFNCYPARVFMGDTGSLSLGGLLGTVAICVRQELMLLVVGGVFVMEALSVILQVGSFKLRGKRIFKMAPIHHHFELMGWKETTVITRFWIIAIMFALAGLATLKIAR